MPNRRRTRTGEDILIWATFGLDAEIIVRGLGLEVTDHGNIEMIPAHGADVPFKLILED